MSVHVFPIMNDSPTSLPIPSLWVIPVLSPEHPVSRIEPGLEIHFTDDNLHASVSFSHIIPPSPSRTESKRPFSTSVSLLLSRIQGYSSCCFSPEGGSAGPTCCGRPHSVLSFAGCCRRVLSHPPMHLIILVCLQDGGGRGGE